MILKNTVILPERFGILRRESMRSYIATFQRLKIQGHVFQVVARAGEGFQKGDRTIFHWGDFPIYYPEDWGPSPIISQHCQIWISLKAIAYKPP
jgi:hypothetical protein